MSESIKTIAKNYLKRGWKPIPVPYKSKSPGFHGWNKIEIDEKFIENRFSDEPQNIGVVLGIPSGNLADIDLDADEAVLMAEHFLPKTGTIFGRTGKPKSHWLYVAAGLKSEKFQDPVLQKAKDESDRKRATLVEIRYTGGQTVFPPSVHLSGEQISWDSEGEAIEIEPEKLCDSVRKLSTASLLARYWKPGMRQDCAMAVSGILLRAGWEVSEVEHFIEGITIGANDDETHDRVNTVNHTATSLSENKPVTGIPALKQLLPQEVVQKMCQWLEIESSLNDKQTQSEKLLDNLEGIDLFHMDGEPYATISVNSHFETLRTNSKAFSIWLTRRFFNREKKPPSRQALQDTIGVLNGRAIFDGEERSVFLRVAANKGKIYLDLCNPTWQVAEISAEGWQVVEAKDCPLRFRRPKGMMALPAPIRGESLDILSTFVNVTDRDFVLLQAWLVASFRPDFPFPVLVLSGTQGSAKSTTTSVLRRLVDPNSGIRRSTPKDERDLAVAANNSWVISLDNMSYCSQTLSDSLCRLATGGSLATRTLYENDEETLFTAKRPIILNSIEDITTRADLLERSILLQLPKIQSNQRQDEEKFEEVFEVVQPFILGALLDAVSTALANIATVRLDELPRMADFARWSVAAQERFSIPDSLKSETTGFLELYEENLRAGHSIALESSPLVKMIESLLLRSDGYFKGTATELHERLTMGEGGMAIPKNGQKLSSALRRLNDALLSVGIQFIEGRESNRNRSRFLILKTVELEELH